VRRYDLHAAIGRDSWTCHALLQAGADAKGKTISTVMLGPSPYVIAAGRAGTVYIGRDDWARADAVMQRGLNLNPVEPWMASQEMLVLTVLKRPEESLKLGDRVIAEQPKIDPAAHAAILRSRAITLISMHRTDDALAAYQIWLKLDPDSVSAKEGIEQLTAKAKSTIAPAPLAAPPGAGSAPH
jgi:tetratricopeptide (TPR) repeat protein